VVKKGTQGQATGPFKIILYVPVAPYWAAFRNHAKEGNFGMGFFFQVGMFALAVYAAYRDESSQVTGDVSPEFVTVIKVEKEKQALTYRLFTKRAVHQIVTEEVDGKSVKRTYLRHVCERQDHYVSLKDIRVYNAKGWRLSQASALEQLLEGATMLKSADGNKVNARYLRSVREDTLIMVVPVVEPIVIAEEVLPKNK
jgi:hypothetical protein